MNNEHDSKLSFTGESAGRSEHSFAAPGVSVIEDMEPASEQEAGEVPLKWNGVELQPFTMSRRALWAQHRLSVGAPRIADCLNDLDAWLADALRILWLCSHEPEDWSNLRCFPLDLEHAISAWAEEAVPIGKTDEAIRVSVLLHAESIPDRPTEF